MGDLLLGRKLLSSGERYIPFTYQDSDCYGRDAETNKIHEFYIMLHETENQSGERVLQVLTPRGIRWVYKGGVEIVK